MSHPAIITLEQKIMSRFRQIVDETTAEAVADLKAIISVPATVGGEGFSFVISSAPGEPPRLRTGKLRDSVYRVVSEDVGTRLFFEIGASAYYGNFLEYGTSRMAARPYREPTRAKWEPELTRRLRAAFSR